MRRGKEILVLAFCAFAISSCTKRSESAPAPGSFEVMFTDPYGEEDLLERALELISGAERCVYVAAYGFDLQDLADALIDAHNRGVVVRIVCEGDRFFSADPDDPYARMYAAGIPIVPDDEPDALTHDKFIVVDSAVVWTGSANFTQNGFFLNNNNVVVISSPEVARAFADQFTQMFYGAFHTEKSPNGVERFPVYDGSVEIWFGPEDLPEQMLQERVDEAREEICFCIYSFTLDGLSSALVAAAERGVVVRGIFDEGNAHDAASEFSRLLSAGIDVRLDQCPYAFHHKFMVIDPDGEDPIVITGSGNFSWSGTHSNDENFVVIHSPSVAQMYREEFERWWESAAVLDLSNPPN